MHALHACRFVLQHGGRALIADEMGLGKTLQVKHCLLDHLIEFPYFLHSQPP